MDTQQARMAQIVLILGEGLATSDVLAGHLDVSVRTIHRDIARLRSSGQKIEGAAGVGFILRRKEVAA